MAMILFFDMVRKSLISQERNGRMKKNTYSTVLYTSTNYRKISLCYNFSIFPWKGNHFKIEAKISVLIIFDKIWR